MATTAKGTPYVVSTDLVANYPTVSNDLATHIDAKLAYNAVTINAQTGSGAGAYTFALADASEGKLVTASNAAAATYTVPPQSSVTWANGAVLRILNIGAGVVTIGAGSGVTVNNTAATLAQYESANIVRTASDVWQVSKAGGLPKASVSSTTGSPTITTVAGRTVYKWTGDGTVVIGGQGGVCDILLVGGGGSGGFQTTTGHPGGGGGGGVVALTSAFLPAGTHTVTLGLGGAANTVNGTAGNIGTASRLGPYYAYGGGGGRYGNGQVQRVTGASGGGGNTDTTTTFLAGLGLDGQGNKGGETAITTAAGGGGGASAAGGAGAANVGGAGGAGVTNNFETGSNQTYGGGGGGTGGTTQGAGGAGGGTAGASGAASAAGTNGLGGGSGGTRNTAAGSGKGGDGVVVLVIG